MEKFVTLKIRNIKNIEKFESVKKSYVKKLFVSFRLDHF